MPGDSPRMASSTSEARRLVGIINATSLKSALVNNNHTGIVASTSNTSGTGKSLVTWEYTRDERARCGGLTREDIRDFFNCGIAGCASVNSFNVVIDCDILAEAGVNYSSHVFDIISILEAFIAAKKTGEYFDVARQWGYVLRNITAGIPRVADPLDNHP
ncbi:hypothetical protein FOZ63_011806 [Perkinsus olseni]|uniref:Uncharacterized protein n=1 Tax=Perkinsus olseni TaxID=32597 RepID=A0A7J6RHW6_PEROL|nr:hypothetical protein FOZ63_011806 [Perkinsus olseni]